MIRTSLHQLEIFQFENLNQFQEIKHCITTRFGGNSKGYLNSFNLGIKSGDNYAQENRDTLAEAMGVPNEHLIFPLQTHSNNYKIISPDNVDVNTEDTDALITASEGIAICSLSADCVPILLYDKRNQVIASVHAGWRGTVNGILKDVVTELMNNFNAHPEDIMAGIGPSICAEVYEVGPEVIEQFEKTFDNSEELIGNRHKDKAHVDLWQANKTWLTEMGVPEGNIEIAGLCTYKNHNTFYSARYFNNKTGRFAAAIKLENKKGS